MINLSDLHLLQDGDERLRDRCIKHIPVGLGEGTCDHELGDIRPKIVDMGQAHVVRGVMGHRLSPWYRCRAPAPAGRLELTYVNGVNHRSDNRFQRGRKNCLAGQPDRDDPTPQADTERTRVLLPKWAMNAPSRYERLDLLVLL